MTQKNTHFVVTKEMLQNFCQERLTVQEMADKLTEMSGVKCSVSVVRSLAKHYDISLRSKGKVPFFVPTELIQQDASEETSITNEVTNTSSENSNDEKEELSFLEPTI